MINVKKRFIKKKKKKKKKLKKKRGLRNKIKKKV